MADGFEAKYRYKVCQITHIPRSDARSAITPHRAMSDARSAIALHHVLCLMQGPPPECYRANSCHAMSHYVGQYSRCSTHTQHKTRCALLRGLGLGHQYMRGGGGGGVGLGWGCSRGPVVTGCLAGSSAVGADQEGGSRGDRRR